MCDAQAHNLSAGRIQISILSPTWESITIPLGQPPTKRKVNVHKKWINYFVDTVINKKPKLQPGLSFSILHEFLCLLHECYNFHIFSMNATTFTLLFPHLIAVPQLWQTGTLSGPPGVPPVLITASPILPLTAPTPVGLDGGALGAGGAGATWGLNGLAAGA